MPKGPYAASNESCTVAHEDHGKLLTEITMDHESNTPLAESLRPQKMDEIIGQDRIWGQNMPLRRLVETGRFTAVLLWGPPGSGKTSLAQVIGRHSENEIVSLSAVEDGVKAIREQIQRSSIRKNHGESPLLLFMDEIHRLNKGQQDVLLPALEKGLVKFIGATTENPSFTVNNAILSRCLVFQLKPLAQEDLFLVLKRALASPESRHHGRKMDDDLIEKIAKSSSGDARQALNLLDTVLSAIPEDQGVSQDDLIPLLHELVSPYDRDGEHHYDVISAFIKSIRASQADAAVYYLARMIEGGEDPMFIARRLVIAASEDIGNANPNALIIATSAMESVRQIGMPEARIILSQVTCYLAGCPKSNRSYLAINEALQDVREHGPLPVPLQLRNAPSKLMKELGYGSGYVYAHDDPEKASQMEYLPQALASKKYYQPSDSGAEKQIGENLKKLQFKK